MQIEGMEDPEAMGEWYIKAIEEIWVDPKKAIKAMIEGVAKGLASKAIICGSQGHWQGF